MNSYRQQIEQDGFAIIENVFGEKEILTMCDTIAKADGSADNFRRSADLFAIRQFLKEVPQIQPIIFTSHFKKMIDDLFDVGNFVIKSIYFDKPEQSNWFVSYHQDLTISVDKRIDVDGFCNWTLKQGQFAVQPPLTFLQKSFTLRIHLDDTDEHNGALKVIPGSHLNGIQRPEDVNKDTEVMCAVPKGGVMIMRPLIMHSSNRTTNNNRRRVVHIEFCNQELPEQLQWSERMEIYQLL